MLSFVQGTESFLKNESLKITRAHKRDFNNELLYRPYVTKHLQNLTHTLQALELI